MNIFFLDKDPNKAVQMLCDCHVVKMTLETAQLFCTYFRRNGFTNNDLYKSTHINHPCQKCLNNFSNIIWLAYYFKAILNEYTYRYGKIHKCQYIFDKYVKPLIENNIKIPYNDLTFPKCMPDEYKVDSVIQSYINYYGFKKKSLKRFKFTKRKEWI